MAQGIASESQEETPAQSRRWFDAALDFVARYREASIAAVAILLVIYIQLNNSVFLTSPLMSVVLRDTARIGMIAAGIVLVMITGEIDLSVGAIYALAPYLMIRMSQDWEVSLWVTAPIAILIGIGVGFFNGVHYHQAAHSVVDHHARYVLPVNRLHGLVREQPTHPHAGAAAVQLDLRAESFWSARFALLVGRTHRLHADHLDH